MKPNDLLNHLRATIHSRALIVLALVALHLSGAPRATAAPSWAQSYGVGSYGGNGKPSTVDPNYGSGYDIPAGIAKMPDGGFVVAGQIDYPKYYAPFAGDPGTRSRSDATLVRFAADGAVIWQRTLHQTNETTGPCAIGTCYYPASSYVGKIAADAQGNIFIAGNKRKDAINGGLLPFVAKFSPAGEMLWQNGITKAVGQYSTPPTPYESGFDHINDMGLTADGGVVLTVTQTRPGQPYRVPALAKFNADGALATYTVFEHPYQGTPVPPVCQTTDGTRYALAFQDTISTHPGGSPAYGTSLVITDLNGAIISQKTWAPLDPYNETPMAVIATADGGIAVLSKEPDSGGMTLRKFDSAGSQALFETLIRSTTQVGFNGTSLAETPDGGFLIGGQSANITPASGGLDPAMMKVRPNGTLEFCSLLGGLNTDGAGPSPSFAYVWAIPALDGGYALTSTTLSYRTDAPNKPDVWVVKTDANRRVQNFADRMVERPLTTFAVATVTRAPGNTTTFRAPNYSVAGVTSTLPAFQLLDPGAFLPPNRPILKIQGSSPRILSSRTAEAIVEQHFSYHTLAGFFPTGATLTYSATGLPSGFVINSQTGVISGIARDGSQTTAPIPVQLHVTDGTSSVDVTLALTISDGAPVLTVNGSDVPANYQPDAVLTFTARQTGNLAGRVMTVEASTTPGVWSRLMNGTQGVMTYDRSSANYLLSTNVYPVANGVRFRVMLRSPAHADVFSNEVGPFNLASSTQRMGSTKLYITQNGPVANIRFGVTQDAAPAAVTVRLQTTTTPATEATWTDVPNGTLTRDPANPTEFYLGFDNYPVGAGVHFRAVSTASGFVPSYSSASRAYEFIFDPPPVVTFSSPAGAGTTGADFDDPIMQTSGQGFNITANAVATVGHGVISLKLLYDGDMIGTFQTPSGTVPYQSNRPGDHLIEAVAEDELGATGDAIPRHIRVAPPAPGKLLYATVDGDWSDANIWTDGQGGHAVPGPEDVAILGPVNVRLTTDVTVKAMSINRGTLDTVTDGQKTLTVTGMCTVGAGRIKSDMLVPPGGTMLLINDTDLQVSGLITVANGGTLKMHGKGGVVGVPSSAARNRGEDPELIGNVLGAIQNAGRWVMDRIAGGRRGSSTPPAPGPTPAPELRPVLLSRVVNTGSITTPPLAAAPPAPSVSAAPVVGNTRSGLVDANAHPLVAQGGGNLVAQGAGNLIAQGGGNLVAQGGGNGLPVLVGGNNLVASGAGNLVAQGAGNRPGPDGQTAFYKQTAGSTDLSGIVIAGSVALNGGVLSGTGLIRGDLVNDGGVIAPVHDYGVMAVTGNFIQNGGGTLHLEAAGAEPTQFDQLQVGGDSMLGGNLVLTLTDGYLPLPEDPFNPVGYAAVSGAFASVTSNAQVTQTPSGLLVELAPTAPAFVAASAVSRKTHGSAGDFDVPLAIGSGTTVECRSATGGNHTIIFTFSNDVVSGSAAVTSGTATLSGAPIISGKTMTVRLSGVANAQRVTVSATNIKDEWSQVLPDTSVTIGFLVGDTNGNGSVNATDIGQTKAQSGQPVTVSNFRTDVTTNGGAISSSDIGLVKSAAGSQLP